MAGRVLPDVILAVFGAVQGIKKVKAAKSAKAGTTVDTAADAAKTAEELRYENYWNDVKQGKYDVPYGMTQEEYYQYLKGVDKVDDVIKGGNGAFKGVEEAWKQGIPLKNNPFPVSSGAKEHLIKTKVKVKTNIGVSGAHNINEFEAALRSTGKDLSNMIDPSDVTEVPEFPGLKDIKYKVPIQDERGNYLDSYKYAQNPKTVYDPTIPGYSDAEIYQYGLEAIENGYQNGYKVFGEASNGMKFIGYIKNGEITNFHPVSSFD